MPMPTSAIGISTEPRGAPNRRVARTGGFSLLELLVVVTIIGIFTGVVVLSLGVLGPDRETEQEAHRLETLLTLVHQQAVLQSRDYGIVFSPHDYRFYFYDYQEMRWVQPANDRLFRKRSMPAHVNLSVEVEAHELMFEATDPNANADADSAPATQIHPQVVILSSGQVTPFKLSIRRDQEVGHYVLSVAINGKVTVGAQGFAAQT